PDGGAVMEIRCGNCMLFLGESAVPHVYIEHLGHGFVALVASPRHLKLCKSSGPVNDFFVLWYMNTHISTLPLSDYMRTLHFCTALPLSKLDPPTARNGATRAEPGRLCIPRRPLGAPPTREPRCQAPCPSSSPSARSSTPSARPWPTSSRRPALTSISTSQR